MSDGAPSHGDIMRAIGNLEGKMTGMEAALRDVKDLLGAMGGRTGALEAQQNRWKGGLAMLTFIAASVSAAVSALIKLVWP